mmetsp:Transcript_28104/g.21028  ORF Transcript_28104/g.21028 Transcript_28104/m.21028 type:complete len:81 (+) Transcript_28104:206-448(+)
MLSRENLWKVFKFLDASGSEMLTYESLSQAFQRKGDFDPDKFNSLMDEVGLRPNQNISYGITFEQFLKIMQGTAQTNKQK